MCSQHGDEIDSDREETRAKFKTLSRNPAWRGFYALPLNDDTGPGRHFEPGKQRSRFSFYSAHRLLQVLASQATVALRNAQMYKEVHSFPFWSRCSNEKRNLLALEKRAG